MKNQMLEIYKMLKKKGLIRKLNPEYEEILIDELHQEEHLKWVDSLPPKEKKEFNFMFNS